MAPGYPSDKSFWVPLKASANEQKNASPFSKTFQQSYKEVNSGRYCHCHCKEFGQSPARAVAPFLKPFYSPKQKILEKQNETDAYHSIRYVAKGLAEYPDSKVTENISPQSAVGKGLAGDREHKSFEIMSQQSKADFGNKSELDSTAGSLWREKNVVATRAETPSRPPSRCTSPAVRHLEKRYADRKNNVLYQHRLIEIRKLIRNMQKLVVVPADPKESKVGLQVY